MVTKKDLLIVVLATFCLTSTLFMILPSRSGIPYDPWADVSGPTQGTEDGTINMRDISYLIQMFGTSGNTTKDVNVTNYYQARPPYELLYGYYPLNISLNQNLPVTYGSTIHVDGYSRMFVSVEIIDCSYHSSVPSLITTVTLTSVTWGVFGAEYPQSSVSATYDGTGGGFSSQVPAQFVTKYLFCSVDFTITSQATSGWVLWQPIVYLRSE